MRCWQGQGDLARRLVKGIAAPNPKPYTSTPLAKGPIGRLGFKGMHQDLNSRHKVLRRLRSNPFVSGHQYTHLLGLGILGFLGVITAD